MTGASTVRTNMAAVLSPHAPLPAIVSSVTIGF
jgi:hypothetical protein